MNANNLLGLIALIFVVANLEDTFMKHGPYFKHEQESQQNLFLTVWDAVEECIELKYREVVQSEIE